MARDGPPRMEARPTGSGRERSSPNRCDQCRGQARHLHDRRPACESPARSSPRSCCSRCSRSMPGRHPATSSFPHIARATVIGCRRTYRRCRAARTSRAGQLETPGRIVRRALRRTRSRAVNGCCHRFSLRRSRSAADAGGAPHSSDAASVGSAWRESTAVPSLRKAARASRTASSRMRVVRRNVRA